jgi:hypothetical protein
MTATILQFPQRQRQAAKAMLDRIEESLGNQPLSEYPPALMEKSVALLATQNRGRAQP